MTVYDRQEAVLHGLSYNHLFKLLIDKKMSQSYICKAAGIAPNTLTKMRKDEKVTLSVLGRICKVLDCDFGDVVGYIDEM